MLNQTFFADGCITTQSRIALNLQEKDRAHIDRFAQIFNRVYYSFIDDAGNRKYSVRLNSPRLWDSLFRC